MKILIKNACIADPQSPFNKQIVDLFIDNGIIGKIGASLVEEADQVVEIPQLHLSPGWVDVFADFSDPGFEFRETVESGAAAAAAGGFTDVFVVPNTKPVVHNKSGVEYLLQKAKSQAINIHPIGAVTVNAEGKELAEMYDMRNSGAVAFSDGKKSIQSAGLLVKALQYVKAFEGVVMQIPDDYTIQQHGLMNEGIVSTQLGLAGKPAMAEELIVNRDIELAKYANSSVHFTGVSTDKSLQQIAKAKSEGAKITCSITPYHVYFCDEDLVNYDANLKVNPPLRTKEDRTLLRKHLAEGRIDCIATHHFPQDSDSKITEFEYAKYGMLGLETAFAVLQTAIGEDMNIDNWIEILAINPRKIFGLSPVVIKEGEKASLSMFNPNADWEVSAAAIYSKSKNTPFVGKTLKGKVFGIVNKDQIVLHK